MTTLKKQLKTFTLSALILITPQLFLAKTTKHHTQAPIFKNLGPYHWNIDTTSKLAQHYFNQGMLLFYGFDYAESERSFRAATVTDPNCAMCYLGYALTLGSKNNTLISGYEIAEARRAIIHAKKIHKPQYPLVKDFADALQTRYQATPGVVFYNEYSGNYYITTPKRNAKAFWLSMIKLAKKYPKNNDIKVISAFANFDLSDWHFWTPSFSAKPNTVIMLSLLKHAIQLDPTHPGALHLYQHAVAHNPFLRNSALPFAKRLAKDYPNMEHLAHMSSHLYLSLGQYNKAIDQNRIALKDFSQQLKTIKAQGFKPSFNTLHEHNYDFLVNAALLIGDQKAAIDAANNVATLAKPWIRKEPGMARFFVMPYWVQARFGLWDQALANPKPHTLNHYVLAMWHYAHGLAAAHRNKPKLAKIDYQAIDKLSQLPLPDENSIYHSKHLLIAKHILAANIAHSRHDFLSEVNQWTRAMQIENQLGIGIDPPSWYLPCVEGLGYAYLNRGQIKLAAAAFTSDLMKFPNNPWSRQGLIQTLRLSMKAKTVDQEYQSIMHTAETFGIKINKASLNLKPHVKLPKESEFLF